MFLAASKCCRTKLFEIKQQHELCVRQKFSISGRYNKYQATFPAHTPLFSPPLSVIASGSIAAYVLWVCEYSALCLLLCFPFYLPCLPKVSSQYSLWVHDPLSLLPPAFDNPLSDLVCVCVCLGRISMLHTFCCRQPIPAALLLMHCPGKAEQVYLNCKTCSFSRCRSVEKACRGRKLREGAANFSKSYRNTKNVEHVWGKGSRETHGEAGRREGKSVQGLEGELTNKHIYEYLPENVSDGQQT